MLEVLTEASRDVKPPQTGTVKFCPRCGRNDRVGPMKERHFAGGELCAGVPVTLEYALINPERSRLERAILDAAIEEYKMEHAADHGSNTILRVDALIAMQKAMKAKREAVAALLAFESKQETK